MERERERERENTHQQVHCQQHAGRRLLGIPLCSLFWSQNPTAPRQFCLVKWCCLVYRFRQLFLCDLLHCLDFATSSPDLGQHEVQLPSSIPASIVHCVWKYESCCKCIFFQIFFKDTVLSFYNHKSERQLFHPLSSTEILRLFGTASHHSVLKKTDDWEQVFVSSWCANVCHVAVFSEVKCDDVSREQDASWKGHLFPGTVPLLFSRNMVTHFVFRLKWIHGSPHTMASMTEIVSI